jgi:hypothetical protein
MKPIDYSQQMRKEIVDDAIMNINFFKDLAAKNLFDRQIIKQINEIIDYYKGVLNETTRT